MTIGDLSGLLGHSTLNILENAIPRWPFSPRGPGCPLAPLGPFTPDSPLDPLSPMKKVDSFIQKTPFNVG